MSQGAADLSRLTGVRSGKNSYYPAYLRSTERTQRAVRAMDTISRAVVRTVEGPRGLLEEVTKAAADHLAAPWAVLALADSALEKARPRFVVVGPDRRSLGDPAEVPENVRLELAAIRSGYAGPSARDDVWVRVPMYLEGRRVGGLAARHGLHEDPEPEDLAVLRILANQAAVSLHTSEQYQAGLSLHRRAQRLHEEARAQARDLAARTAELEAAEQMLAVAQQRELIDAERHRIARELHDSVTQYVLSAGMSVEVARGEAAAMGAADVAGQLETAKSLTQAAVEQLRSAIFALTRSHTDSVASLEDLLTEVTHHHRPMLDIKILVEGRALVLDPDVHHEIARGVGEALFNVVTHAAARRAVVRVRWLPSALVVSVSDDGDGEPAALRRMLQLERRSVRDGRHQGLANMDCRVRGLGGSLAFRRSRLGGVRVVFRVPLPVVRTPLVGLELHDHQEAP
ncbi:MadS family sensor histidine kinase [Phycicoccus flavus]|uniref:MadS family sensor histidine kinase n=1 Tax=Phycicoccus flavus TaxID=2502783 RepID=UPI000FEC021F|nr:histidine kinase [Phycicoccus flavus]NHA67423.1 sensor histidine kinase [Phycicoccus flavus]